VILSKYDIIWKAFSESAGRVNPRFSLLLLFFGYFTGILWDVLIKPVEAIIRIFTGGSL